MVFCYLFRQFLVALIIGLSFFLPELSQMALNRELGILLYLKEEEAWHLYSGVEFTKIP